MERRVLLALLCIGVASVCAIAASIPEPIRTLSHAEKAELIAGACYSCPDCKTADYECSGIEECYPGGPCDDYDQVQPVNTRCDTDGTDYLGNCAEDTYMACYKEMVCVCEVIPERYRCDDAEWSDDVYRWHYKLPCWE